MRQDMPLIFSKFSGFAAILLLLTLVVALSAYQFNPEGADEDSASRSIGRVISELHSRHHNRPGRRCWQRDLSHLSRSQITRCARRFLSYSNYWLRVWDHMSEVASFRYEVDITEKKRKTLKHVEASSNKFTSQLTLSALKFKKYNMRLSRSEKRMMKFLQWRQVYTSSRDLARVGKLQSKIMQDYNVAVGCYAPRKCLKSGEDNVKNFFRTKNDYDQLRYLWKSWRDATGGKFRNAFVERAQLLNASVRPAGFKDYAYFDYFTAFEDPKFPDTVVSLYNQFKPLYEQLHAYLRHRLLLKYPGRFAPDGLLPGHLGDDPWGSQYTKWNKEFAPFPAAESIDFDGILKGRESRGLLSVMQLPHIADEFYRSLGLPRMTKTFWHKSVFLKAKDHKMNCHGTAFDMYSVSKDDFRIKMCTRMDMSSFSTVHHEMGHIMYFMLYSHLPNIFRRGANGGFHEAVGDTITLSVLTAKHFKAIKFVERVNDTSESQVNILFTQALTNILFLPYALVADLWKWRYNGGQVSKERLNEDWWQLRSRFQGIGPPVARSEADTDPLSKFHIANDYGYIRYFVSFLLKFQFYKAMCEEAGHTGPLAKCDFYRSTAAGDKLRRTLQLGRSKPWPDALQQLTGRRDISADALMEYFQPLHNWLKDFNTKNGVPVGWTVPANPMQSASN